MQAVDTGSGYAGGDTRLSAPVGYKAKKPSPIAEAAADNTDRRGSQGTDCGPEEGRTLETPTLHVFSADVLDVRLNTPLMRAEPRINLSTADTMLDDCSAPAVRAPNPEPPSPMTSPTKASKTVYQCVGEAFGSSEGMLFTGSMIVPSNLPEAHENSAPSSRSISPGLRTAERAAEEAADGAVAAAAVELDVLFNSESDDIAELASLPMNSRCDSRLEATSRCDSQCSTYSVLKWDCDVEMDNGMLMPETKSSQASGLQRGRQSRGSSRQGQTSRTGNRLSVEQAQVPPGSSISGRSPANEALSPDGCSSRGCSPLPARADNPVPSVSPDEDSFLAQAPAAPALTTLGPAGRFGLDQELQHHEEPLAEAPSGTLDCDSDSDLDIDLDEQLMVRDMRLRSSHRNSGRPKSFVQRGRSSTLLLPDDMSRARSASVCSSRASSRACSPMPDRSGNPEPPSCCSSRAPSPMSERAGNPEPRYSRASSRRNSRDPSGSRSRASRSPDSGASARRRPGRDSSRDAPQQRTGAPPSLRLTLENIQLAIQSAPIGPGVTAAEEAERKSSKASAGSPRSQQTFLTPSRLTAESIRLCVQHKPNDLADIHNDMKASPSTARETQASHAAAGSENEEVKQSLVSLLERGTFDTKLLQRVLKEMREEDACQGASREDRPVGQEDPVECAQHDICHAAGQDRGQECANSQPKSCAIVQGTQCASRDSRPNAMNDNAQQRVLQSDGLAAAGKEASYASCQPPVQKNPTNEPHIRCSGPGSVLARALQLASTPQITPVVEVITSYDNRIRVLSRKIKEAQRLIEERDAQSAALEERVREAHTRAAHMQEEQDRHVLLLSEAHKRCLFLEDGYLRLEKCLDTETGKKGHAQPPSDEAAPGSDLATTIGSSAPSSSACSSMLSRPASALVSCAGRYRHWTATPCYYQGQSMYTRPGTATARARAAAFRDGAL